MKEKKIQFSKVTVVFCLLVAVLGMVGVGFATTFYALDMTVGAAIVAACGCLGVTAEVWSLKKSQAENTVKIYLGAYRDILELKKQYSEDVTDTITEMESDILGKVDETLDNTLSDATAAIERQDIY